MLTSISIEYEILKAWKLSSVQNRWNSGERNIMSTIQPSVYVNFLSTTLQVLITTIPISAYGSNMDFPLQVHVHVIRFLCSFCFISFEKFFLGCKWISVFATLANLNVLLVC